MSDRLRWMEDVCAARNKMIDCRHQEVVLSVTGREDGRLLHPEHITSLACLIDVCKQAAADRLRMLIPLDLKAQLEGVLHITEYWTGGKKYVRPASDDYLNLWRWSRAR